MKIVSYKSIVKRSCCALIIIALLEIVFRMLLIFPVYDADAAVGYWIRPNQKGSYLLRNDWVFNDQSMGVGQLFRGTRNFDLLLVGDSVVLGGNPLQQRDKLGPTLARNTGWSVWPLSAGSWAMQNELVFIQRHSGILKQVDAVAFVFNSGDFGVPSSWASEITHPRSYPRSYLWYAIRKCCFKPNTVPPKGLLVTPRDPLEMWDAFNAQSKIPVIAIAYSQLDESGDSCNWVPLSFRKTGNWFCYRDLRPDAGRAYRDGVHPTRTGDERLAEFISSATRSYMAIKMPARSSVP